MTATATAKAERPQGDGLDWRVVAPADAASAGASLTVVEFPTPAQTVEPASDQLSQRGASETGQPLCDGARGNRGEPTGLGRLNRALCRIERGWF
ncbi:MAG: hypothetical protein AAF661_08730 [Pseudomonadota bacterium]